VRGVCIFIMCVCVLMLLGTINTLAEAQSTFGTLNAPMLYKKMDRISNQYTEFKDALSDTSSMLADNFNAATTGGAPEASDAELLAELEQLGRDMAGPGSSDLPNVPVTSTFARSERDSVLNSYKLAGLV
jgi:hypothetical protein